MTEKQAKAPSCPFCWDHKHKCPRDPTTGQCEKCTKYLADCPEIQAPSLFYNAGAHTELYKALPRDSLASLDVTPDCGDGNSLVVQITIDGSLSHSYTFDIDGPFSTHNTNLVSDLDKMVYDTLAPDLRASDLESPIFDKAISTIGYANLLCSTSQVIEQTSTTRDGIEAANEYAHYNLHTHFQYVVLCRLGELLKEASIGIHLEDPEGEFRAYTLNAFAGGVVLRYHLDYLKRSLESGGLSELGHMSPTFKQIIVDWFGSVTHELSQRIRRGCGQYPDWQTAIVGSLKKSRQSGTTLKLDLSLHQTRYTTTKTEPTTEVYTPWGNIDSYIVPYPASPMLQVPGLSYDNLGEMEQIPSHVCGPLSCENDTWDETSVMAPFPDLQQSTFMT